MTILGGGRCSDSSLHHATISQFFSRFLFGKFSVFFLSLSSSFPFSNGRWIQKSFSDYACPPPPPLPRRKILSFGISLLLFLPLSSISPAKPPTDSPTSSSSSSNEWLTNRHGLSQIFLIFVKKKLWNSHKYIHLLCYHERGEEKLFLSHPVLEVRGGRKNFLEERPSTKWSEFFPPPPPRLSTCSQTAQIRTNNICLCSPREKRTPIDLPYLEASLSLTLSLFIVKDTVHHRSDSPSFQPTYFSISLPSLLSTTPLRRRKKKNQLETCAQKLRGKKREKKKSILLLWRT